MKIWYDSCTGKHVRYANAIAKRLKHKHEMILTARKHPDIIPLIEMLGIADEFKVIGEYLPYSLYDRLYGGLVRSAHLASMIKYDNPDLLICHQSVDACRTAFGLEIPIICTADSPQAVAVNKLTVPLTDKMIISKAIPSSLYYDYGAKSITTFNGVDEVAWINDPASDVKFAKPLIVIRQAELKASYLSGTIHGPLTNDIMSDVASECKKFGGTLLFLSRGYEESHNFIDSLSLAESADVFVGIGGTMSREFALKGVPTIVINQITEKTKVREYVNEYLSEKDFPLFFANDVKDAIELVEEHIGKRRDVSSLVRKITNPVDIIEVEVNKFA